tara:strand:+ start:130 stop:312 length:183 start_codon:yes stop_codon:yes gene_type:complete
MGKNSFDSSGKWVRYGISDIVTNEAIPKYACVMDSNEKIIAEPEIYFVEYLSKEETEDYE